MKIICGDLDEQHSDKTGSKYSSLLFLGLEISKIYFFGFAKRKIFTFLGAEFLLGLSPPVLVNKKSPPGQLGNWVNVASGEFRGSSYDASFYEIKNLGYIKT